MANSCRLTALSRRRHRQQLLVLRIVVALPQPRRHEHQIVVHFIAHEDLAELRDEGAGFEMAGELLKLAEVVGWGFTHQVAEGRSFCAFSRRARMTLAMALARAGLFARALRQSASVKPSST